MIRGLYGIADAAFGDPVGLGAALLRAGVRVLQVRAKGWPPGRIVPVLAALRPRCARAGVPLIVNDHPGLAGLADGVHLGQEDGPLDRSSLPAGCIVGRSTHDLDQLAAAAAEGADYAGFGPIFPSTTRPGAHAPLGIAGLALAVAGSPLPIVAIGGIDAARLPAIRATGVAAWAAISATLAAPDPERAARELR